MVTTQLQSLDTVLHADTVAWCTGLQDGDFLACGTYQLHEDTGCRKGGVHLYNLYYEMNETGRCPKLRECLKARNEISGVLDMRWANPVNECPYLFIACADGHLKMLRIHKDPCDDSYSLKVDQNIPIGSIYKETSSCDESESCDSGRKNRRDTICLSVDHHNDRLLTSDNNGYITMISISNGRMDVVKQWMGHTHEAWVSSFANDNNIVLSGGDDCKLCMWDTRCNPCLCLASKRHEMGVVSIQSHPVDHNIFASGSYDEILSLWDQRNPRKPLQELSVGGGVWRIKWNCIHPEIIALACMHGGFKIVNVSSNSVIASYNEHQSLAYGLDWYPDDMRMELESDLYTGLLASCSFYDHSLHLWTCKNSF